MDLRSLNRVPKGGLFGLTPQAEFTLFLTGQQGRLAMTEKDAFPADAVAFFAGISDLLSGLSGLDNTVVGRWLDVCAREKELKLELIRRAIGEGGPHTVSKVAPTAEELVRELRDLGRLTECDLEALDSGDLLSDSYCEYFGLESSNKSREIANAISSGEIFGEQRSRVWVACAKSCVLKMHGIRDPRLTHP